jgi:tetratricopeptide (TPR) repeat protein
MRNKNSGIKSSILAFFFFFAFLGIPLFAQEEPSAKAGDTAALKEKIEKNDADSLSAIESLLDVYFNENNYDECYRYLESLTKKGFDKSAELYFDMALTRSEEIAYWQQTKNWEEVYDKAADYKKEITDNLDKAESFTADKPDVLLGVKYLRWQTIGEDDPDRAFALFNELVYTAKSMPSSPAILDMIKQIADDLSSFEDKSMARRFYEIYVSKLSESHLSKEELKASADKFLNDGNAFLAKSLYEAYLDQLADNKALWAKEMVAVADKFIHTGREEGLDPGYAEAMYQKAFDSAGKEAFDAGAQYRRAYNLERIKDFEAAGRQYQGLLDIYGAEAPRPEIYFRLGVLAAYAQKDIPLAQKYFLKIRDEFPKDPLALSALYQLGLLSQWQNEADQAKGFYNALLSLAKESGQDLEKNELILFARDRQKEMEEKKEMSYGLKLFLEGTFKLAKQGGGIPLNVDLTARPAKMDLNQSTKFVVTTPNPATGCLVPAYSYEWSGQTGSVANIPNAPELTTDYSLPGLKVTHVAVLDSTGLQGVGFEIVQVQGPEAEAAGSVKLNSQPNTQSPEK